MPVGILSMKSLWQKCNKKVTIKHRAECRPYSSEVALSRRGKKININHHINHFVFTNNFLKIKSSYYRSKSLFAWNITFFIVFLFNAVLFALENVKTFDVGWHSRHSMFYIECYSCCWKLELGYSICLRDPSAPLEFQSCPVVVWMQLSIFIFLRSSLSGLTPICPTTMGCVTSFKLQTCFFQRWAHFHFVCIYIRLWWRWQSEFLRFSADGVVFYFK